MTWKELSDALPLGNTFAKNETNKNSEPLKKGEIAGRRVKPSYPTDYGLRPLVGDYWGKPMKTRKNPHGLGLQRYCGLHEKPMKEGFRKAIGKHGKDLCICEDCETHLLFPPKTKMDMKQVEALLKPFNV